MRLIRLMGLMVVLLVAGCGRPVMEYDSFPVDMSHFDVLLDEVGGRRVTGGTVASVLASLHRYDWELVCVAGDQVVVRRTKRNNEIGSFRVQYRKD